MSSHGLGSSPRVPLGRSSGGMRTGATVLDVKTWLTTVHRCLPGGNGNKHGVVAPSLGRRGAASRRGCLFGLARGPPAGLLPAGAAVAGPGM